MSKTKEQFAGATAFAILGALSLSHAFNDAFQSLIAALYPLLKDSLALSYSQIGLITLTFQFSSSMFQPIVGWYTDKKPQPYSLPFGMTSTMIGLFLLSQSNSFSMVLISVAMIGFGSSVFHPEASRLAYMASGGRFGLAQSLFQVGGNLGSSLGPLMAALIVVKYGQKNVSWFCPVALLAIVVMLYISRWYKENMHLLIRRKSGSDKSLRKHGLTDSQVHYSIAILLTLIFSKHVYLASLTSYYTFYIIEKFGVHEHDAPFYLFIYLFSVAVGTLIGGPIGDRVGRKYVIWFSILGVSPFTLALPYVNNLYGTAILSAVIGLILASAFSAILVYAQELMPGKVGMIAGLFFGFAFGIAGIASAVLGWVADHYGITFVYHVCSFLPLIGFITVFLPDLRKRLATR